MFAISTSDYAISRGDRPPSPLATDEELKIFEKNQINKRDKIEFELNRIPKEDQTNLLIFLKVYGSDYYVKQKLEVKIVKRGININDKNFESYTPCIDSELHPEIWKGFNHTPFYPICKECNKTIPTYKYYDALCKPCKVLKIYLNVAYKEKDEAKKFGAKWDNEKKKWYIFNDNLNKEKVLTLWTKSI